VFSLPDGGNALNLRRERFELARLVREIARVHGKAVELRVLQYGATRQRLENALLEQAGWDVVHLSGHGLADGLVLEDDAGRVRASAQLKPNQSGPGAHVANASFMVDPRAAGQGFGRRLGEAVLARARERGFRAMQFNAVVATNTAAVRLWRSLGFEVVGTVPEAFQHPTQGLVDIHVMHRRL
jgi:GNAT superfamily N-acetyltransferase